MLRQKSRKAFRYVVVEVCAEFSIPTRDPHQHAAAIAPAAAIAGFTWEEMKLHIATATIDDVTSNLLDLPGLLRTKQGVRPKDQMDAAVIAAR